MGWGGMGWDGVNGQKCSLFFFILRYIKYYTHIYLYTKEKLSGQISCGFKILDKLGVRIKKNQKHPLGRIFLKSV